MALRSSVTQRTFLRKSATSIVPPVPLWTTTEEAFLDEGESTIAERCAHENTFDEIFAKAAIFVVHAPLGFDKIGPGIRPRGCVVLCVKQYYSGLASACA